MKWTLLALTFLGFAIGFGQPSFAQTPPPHWGELKSMPPNVATYVYMNSAPEKESSVTLQVHDIEGKVQTLRDQIKQSKLPKNFGALKLLRQEKFNPGCTRLSLENSGKKSAFERQTWCFSKTKAWVVVERGSWKIGDKFIVDVLKKNGWDVK